MKNGILTVRKLKKLLKLVPKDRINEAIVIWNDGNRYYLDSFIDFSIKDSIELNVKNDVDVRLGENCLNYMTGNCNEICDGCRIDNEVDLLPEKIVLSRKEIMGRLDYTSATCLVKRTKVLISIYDEDGSLIFKRFENLTHIPRVGETIVLSRPYLDGSSIGGTVSKVCHNYLEDGSCIILLEVESVFNPKIEEKK